MNTNKIIIISSIVVIILLLTIPTVYKVVTTHYEHLYESTYDKIIDSAKKCYYDSVCQEDKITLKMLYENNYLTTVNNPVTKEIYNENSYVKKEDKEFIFVVVE